MKISFLVYINKLTVWIKDFNTGHEPQRFGTNIVIGARVDLINNDHNWEDVRSLWFLRENINGTVVWTIFCVSTVPLMGRPLLSVPLTLPSFNTTSLVRRTSSRRKVVEVPGCIEIRFYIQKVILKLFTTMLSKVKLKMCYGKLITLSHPFTPLFVDLSSLSLPLIIP